MFRWVCGSEHWYVCAWCLSLFRVHSAIRERRAYSWCMKEGVERKHDYRFQFRQGTCFEEMLSKHPVTVAEQKQVRHDVICA